MPLTIYADPYLACDQCRQRTVGYDRDAPGLRNEPCGHAAGMTSVCPSWSPVDGCNCIEQLGRRDHGEPPLPAGYPDPLNGRNR